MIYSQMHHTSRAAPVKQKIAGTGSTCKSCAITITVTRVAVPHLRTHTELKLLYFFFSALSMEKRNPRRTNETNQQAGYSTCVRKLLFAHPSGDQLAYSPLIAAHHKSDLPPNCLSITAGLPYATANDP